MKVRKTFRNIAQYIPQVLVLLSILISNVFFPAVAIAEEVSDLQSTNTQVQDIPVDESEDILDEGIATSIYDEEEADEPLFVYEDGVYTVNTVVEGEEYVYPDNSDVRITFNEVTEDGNLVIKRVVLTEEEKELLNTSDDYGWDISSSMSNESFSYDLTLPNTQGNDVEVKYTEDGTNYESVDDVVVNEGVVEIKGLEHFTVFVITVPDPVSVDCSDVGFSVSNGDTCYNTIQDAVDNANSGDDIEIVSGYSHNGEQVTIDKSLTINGNGQSINAGFDIILGAQVVINNLIIENISGISGFSSQSTASSEIIINSVFESSKLTLNNVTMSHTMTTVGNKINLVGVNVRGTGELEMNNSTMNLINESLVYGVYGQKGSPVINMTNNTFKAEITPNTIDNRKIYFIGHEIGADNSYATINLTSNTYNVTINDPSKQTFYEVMLYAYPASLSVADINTYIDGILTTGEKALIYYPSGSNWSIYPDRVHNITKGLYYSEIQDAIDDAADGNVIEVAAGTYEEQVVIEKSIELISEENATILTPDTLSSTPVDGSGESYQSTIFINNDSTEIEVTIDGFVINANNFSPTGRYSGILIENANAHIKNNEIINILVNGKETFGIIGYGNKVLLEENTIPNFARGGIGIYSGSATIKNNIVTGPGPNEIVTWAPNGIQIGYGASGTIEGNEVSGCGWPGTEWSGTGIMIVDTSDVNIVSNTVIENEQGIAVVDFPAVLYGSIWEGIVSDIKVLDNIVIKNSWGLSISNEVSNIHVEGNHFSETEYDNIDVYTYAEGVNPPSKVVIYKNKIESAGSDQLWVGDRVTETVNAEENWWGSDKFEEVSAGVVGNADYCPWLDAEDGNPVGPCLGDLRGRTFIDNNWNGLLLSSDGDYSSGMKDGFTVRLYGKDWNPLEQQTTNTTGEVGQFHFANLDNTNNTYYVCGAYREGYFYSPAQIGQEVIHTNGNPVTGYKYAEIVSNESTVPDESPVCWKITLDSETDGAYLGIGYTQEAPGTPTQTGYKDTSNNTYSCANDYTKESSIAVYWSDVSTGETPPNDMLLYQRQYSLNGTSWSGSEIYSDPYTNQRSFGGGEGYDGVFYSRVRAFYDINKDGTYSSGEPVSAWSNVCSITHDSEKPVITLELPENGKVYSGVIDLKAVCNEDCDYINFWWREEEQPYSNTPPDRRYHYIYTDGTEFNWSLNTLNAERWGGDPSYVMPDGIYYIYAAGKDLAGNWARTTEVKIIVDNTPPTVSITSPNDGGLYNTNVTLSGTVDDANPHHYWLEITKDGENLDIPGITGEQSATEFTTTLTEEGEYHVTFAARDAAGGTNRSGNRSGDVNISFTIDKTDPEVSTVTLFANGNLILDNGYTNSYNFTFNLSSSADTTRYQLKYWNDILGSPFKENSPWSPTDIEGYMNPFGSYNDKFTQGEGKHYFSFSACDAADNCSGFTDPYIVTYDKTQPTITDLSVDKNYVKKGDVLTITANVTDSSGVVAVLADFSYNPEYTNSPSPTSVSMVNTEGDTYSVSYIIPTSWNEGIMYIKVAAEDNTGGNWIRSSSTVEVTVDNTDPKTLFDNDTNELSGQYVSESLTIGGVSTDGSGIEKVTLSYRETGDIDWIKIIEIENSLGDLPFDWQYTWTPPEDGTYDIKASATDVVGNKEQSPTIDAVTYDTTKPNITLLQIISGILSIDANDSLSGYEKIEFKIDDGEWQTYSSDVDLLSLVNNEPGTYTIYVRVSDKAGNVIMDEAQLIVLEPDTPAVEGATDTQDTEENDTQTYYIYTTNEENGTGSGTEITDENGEDQTEETTTEEVLGEETQTCDNAIEVRGYIYLDKNKDDIRDENEKGIAGVSIRTYYIDEENNEITIDTLTTNEEGYWETTLCPGDYYMAIDQETLPENLKTSDVIEVQIADDLTEPVEFNISATDMRNFWQKYWYIVLIVGALLFTTAYIIITGSRKEQQQYTQ
jgi:hypothetical protein